MRAHNIGWCGASPAINLIETSNTLPQGKGIRLAQGGAGGRRVTRAAAALPPDCPAVAQHYLSRPLLIRGLKFDLRVYALVTSADPLRLFVYREGLVRFCTSPYQRPAQDNLDCRTGHLTNYAVNKKAGNFVAPASGQPAGSSSWNVSPQQQQQQPAADGSPDQQSHKWTFKQLQAHLESAHGPQGTAAGGCWSTVWASIQELVVKSLISVAPLLRDTYRQAFPASPSAVAGGAGGSSGAAAATTSSSSRSRCFEILGFDVLIDEGMRPWLLEVNHSPSFNMDSSLDR